MQFTKLIAIHALAYLLCGCSGGADAHDGAPLDTGVSDDSSGPTLIQVAAGGAHTCAVVSTGAVRCWGAAADGQLGYGNTDNIGDDEVPSSAGNVDVGGSVVSLAAGDGHTCALLDTGAVRCWGRASSGQLGYGNTDPIGDFYVPARAGDVPLDGAAVQLTAGTRHTCALLQGGTVQCWGSSGRGQLGYGNTGSVGSVLTPDAVGVVPVGGRVVQIAAGSTHTCAVLDDASVRCWGEGRHGELGYGNVDNVGDDETPASVGAVDVGEQATEIAAGLYHTCALLVSGNVRCWGNADEGKLGYGNTDTIGDDEPPSSVGTVELGGPVATLAAGDGNTCAVLVDGAVRCWGDGARGQLGYFTPFNLGDIDVPTSVDPVDVGARAQDVTIGAVHTCVRSDEGEVTCWGVGFFGQLGYGNAEDVGDDETPAQAGTVSVL